MNIQQIDIKQIRPYENNPRKNDKAVATVIKSLEEYGFQQPIVVDKNNVIIVGHTRYRAAQQLGFTQVPVLVAHELTERQVTAYRIMDNRSNENARWDDSLLLDELRLLLDQDTQQLVSEHTGFTEAELNRMFPDTSIDDNIDAMITKSYRSRTGDVWILGDHRLINGDSTNAEDIAQVMQDDKIDLLWEDPPYGISYDPTFADGRDFTIQNDNLNKEQLIKFLQQHVTAILGYVKLGTPIYWCHDIRYNKEFKEILESFNFNINNTLIWNKLVPSQSSHMMDYTKSYEPILYGWLKGDKRKWYGISNKDVQTPYDLEKMSKEEIISYLKTFANDIIEFKKEKKDVAGLHPTVKPTKLVAYHITNSSRVNDIVFDGFAGSGAVILAAEKTGRRARCVEFEPKFCDVIIQRWQELTGLQATRASDGVKWDDIQPTDASIEQQITENLEKLFDMEAAS